MSPKGLKKWCCGDQLMFNWGAPIGIPCYFTLNSMGFKFGQNNMGSLWEHPNWTLVSHHNITFSDPWVPYKDIPKRKSILLVEVLCQPTIKFSAYWKFITSSLFFTQNLRFMASMQNKFYPNNAFLPVPASYTLPLLMVPDPLFWHGCNQSDF